MADLAALALAFVLLLAVVMDHVWGEPSARFHPVVWMGRYLTICGSVAARRAPAPAFVLGAIGWCAGAAAVGGLAWAFQGLVFSQGLGQALVPLLLLSCAWLLKCMLSWRMLREEAGAVEAALAQSLDAGRDRLSRLVSRSTTQLSESEVRESAIESLAENLNDSVVAPIFWFVLFGLPGAVIYRFANTADAMWGYRGFYRGQHWEWAGKWAARADDVLSWLPARVTALLLAWAAGGLSTAKVRSEARKTPSPNSGWPMAAMALALGVRLGKPGVYTLNPQGRVPEAGDAVAARRLASRAIAAALSVAVAVIAALGAMGVSWAM